MCNDLLISLPVDTDFLFLNILAIITVVLLSRIFRLHIKKNTVEHIYDACPKYSELGSFIIIAYLYVSNGIRH